MDKAMNSASARGCQSKSFSSLSTDQGICILVVRFHFRISSVIFERLCYVRLGCLRFD
jgi:hypothetical protein